MDKIETLKNLILERKPEEARAFIKSNRLNDNPSQELQIILGKLIELENDTDKAIEHYNKMLEKDPSCIQAMIELSGIFIRKEKHDKAEKLLRNAVTILPVAHSYALLGAVLLKQDRLKEAKEALDNASKLDEKFPETLMVRAEIALKEKDPKKAASFLKAALALNPTLIEAKELLSQMEK